MSSILTFIPTNVIHSSTASADYVSDSDAESSTVSFKGLQHKAKITVQRSRSKTGDKITKRLCCVYCESLTTKLYRHLENKHSNELEVAHALSLPIKSSERKRAWTELAARGMYVHNEKVKLRGSGLIIPKYRARISKQSKEYLPCEFCKAEFVATVALVSVDDNSSSSICRL